MFKKVAKLLLFGVFALSSLAFSATQSYAGFSINGAGSTFAYPVYTKWAYEYERATGNKVNYQGVGSGAGIQQVSQGVVAFGGTDMCLSRQELVKKNLLQFPSLVGGILIVVNIPGIKDNQLKLSNAVIPKIFLGEIKFWDDPQIKKDNPNLKLPHIPITVVHRADGSGTNWNVTYWLSQISKAWNEKVHYGLSVNWPTGVGGKGNMGVSNYVKQIKGSIGYVEYAFWLQNHLTSVELQNKAGKWVIPSIAAFKEAAEKAQWAPQNGFCQSLAYQPGVNTWPIVSGTFVLIPKKPTLPHKEAAEFFKWGFAHGDKAAESLGYIPLPQSTKNTISKYLQDNGL
ncbi:phosphate ABC transporter substrate-binding protein PstS [Desulfurella sp.]|uniref:phosphate ABC transporter substrate-binding protein PstS n=1 Tax=Desulfurella sp. TaxID=1962857 RepID=UPI0025BC2D6B|nr:phosphate ABC transporter substrate-binding protein PstS [Desulfurella sp.]